MMPKPIADDFDYIRARMAEIADPQPAPDVCRTCDGTGWVSLALGAYLSADVCPLCFNPDDHPCP